MVFIILYLPIEIPRVLVATKGVRVEQPTPIIISLVMALIIAVLHVYYITWQTFVNTLLQNFGRMLMANEQR